MLTAPPVGLYYLPFGRRRRYPAWQFDGRLGLLPNVNEMIVAIPASWRPHMMNAFMSTLEADLTIRGEPITPRMCLAIGLGPAAVIEMIQRAEGTASQPRTRSGVRRVSVAIERPSRWLPSHTTELGESQPASSVRMMLRIEMNGAAAAARLTASKAAKTTSYVPGRANHNGETVTDPGDQARLKRLQGVRTSMELLHAEALAERDGRTFTTEETRALIR